MFTIVLTLLKTLPIKDYIYVGAITVILGLCVYFVRHERSIGAAAVVAADARAASAQLVHDADVESKAKQLVAASTAIYNDTLRNGPAPDAPSVLVCQRPPTDSGPMPGDASPRRGVHAGAAVSTDLAPVSESTVEHPIDIGPATDKQFQDADAEITALQAYIRACQTEGMCAK